MPKVTHDTAPMLVEVIAFRSIVDYCEIDLAQLSRYRNIRVNGKEYDLERIMTTRPSSRIEQRLKRKIIREFKKIKITYRNDSTFLKHAEHWYKSRVEPGDIEIYVAELADTKYYDQVALQDGTYPDRDRIENDIAPYDEVTGYPRKWRNRPELSLTNLLREQGGSSAKS